ncbi:MAG: efflux RND transporter periplasmic adaptor subunit [Verrucomicrobia bacterium]|nr:efflux RND transporter periplasmic adaptor subunit [Verrucomicrobiota bacterium]
MNSPALATQSKGGLVRKIRLPLFALFVAVLASVSLMGGFWRSTPAGAARIHARRVLFYEDSMHPWIKSNHPGKCTICDMDLTAIYEGEKGADPVGSYLSLSSNAITVLSVQTEAVKRQAISRTFRVAGTIEANETRRIFISAPAPGRIESLAVDYAGVEVREGQRLLTFFSPELTQERRRYVFRAKMADQRDPTGGLAMPKTDADPYYSDLVAPQGGTVIERKVTRGQFVSEGERLFTIADASVLWFRFDVYERQLPWLRTGQKIEVTTEAVPGRVFSAVISFIEPMLNEATRTVKVRADIQNPIVEYGGKKERLLRFGLYAEGLARAELPEVLAVPRSAVLYPGHSAYAYVEKATGTYERRRVKLGREANGCWEVIDGLAEGERVVISGNTLIDAQAQFDQNSDEGIGAMEPPVRLASLSPSLPTASEQATAVAEDHVSQTAEPASAAQGEASVDGVAEQASACPPKKSPAIAKAMASKPPAGSRPNAAMASMKRRGGDDLAGNVHGGRGGKQMLEDLIFERLREVRSAEMAEAAIGVTNPPAKMSEAQCRAMQEFLAVPDGLSQALAADDLNRFNERANMLPKALAELETAFPLHDSWKGMIIHFRETGKWVPAKDLAEARARFVPFSANIVALVQELRKQEQGFAEFKTYHCPMAPNPGLWVQTKGTLANPFFGAKMLRCGEEIKLQGDLALQQAEPTR